MKKISCFVFLAWAASASAMVYNSAVEDGVGVFVTDEKDDQGRMAKPYSRAPAGQFPEVAYFGKSSGQSFKCGAAIIKEKFLVTAASCFWDTGASPPKMKTDPSDWNVDTGVDSTDTPQLEMANIYISPDFSFFPVPGKYVGDIAIIELKKSLEFSFRTRASKLGKDPPRNENMFFPGWGVDNDGSNSPRSRLAYMATPAMDLKDCTSQYANSGIPWAVPKKGIICTPNNYRNQHIGYCVFDGGNALHHTDSKNEISIYGVASNLNKKMTKSATCPPTLPNTYTSIKDYTKWIEDTIKAAEASKE